jgi:hypothetical protein
MIDVIIDKAITVTVFGVGVAILSRVYNESNEILEWFGLVWWLYKGDGYAYNLIKALKEVSGEHLFYIRVRFFCLFSNFFNFPAMRAW